MAGKDNLHPIPLRITDTTLRDAHQSLWATRMRTKDIEGIIDTIDQVGYYSLECWGGATFDVCLRFLRENPWERLRLIKSKAKNTPLQMLLRGQNLVGYKNYADDVVDRFIAHAIEEGIEIFRVFDALNDTRNLEAAVKSIKKHGAHAQGTLAYTLSPVHTVEKYIEYAKEQVAIGIDSLCIKDMAGILSPIMSEKLVTALIKETNIPIQIHCHTSSGMATAAYVSGVEAGAGAIDCSISPMAGYSSQPPAETLATIFNETSYSAGLDFDALEKVAAYFDELKPHRVQKAGHVNVIDPNILIHQIPGGMISNFRSQLDMQGALDKLPQVLDEVTKVRADLGYCPLVTPTSQIVGTQAVMNVIAGERYKIVPNEVKDYLLGKYGRPPVAVKDEMLKKVLGDQKPIDHRPADELEPMLPTATDSINAEFIEAEEDILSYLLLPEPALEYFKWRAQPEDERDPIPADVELEKMKEEDKQFDKDFPSRPKPPAGYDDRMVHPDDYKGIAHILGTVQNINLDEFVIKKGDFSVSLRSNGATGTISASQTTAAPAATPAQQAAPAAEQKEEPAAGGGAADASEYTQTIVSPLVGTYYEAPGPDKPVFAKPGDTIKAGDPVCIVEAMKLFNEIEAPFDCKIIKILVENGEKVDKDQPLIAIEEL